MSVRDVKGAVNDAIGKSLLRGDWPSERADTVLAALDAAGYAVVPKEPTEKMLQAKIHIRATGQDVMESRYDLRPTIWKVMLTAAKETP